MSTFNQMGRIAREVAEARGVTIEDIRGRCKFKPIVYARHEVFARCYELRGDRNDSPYSLPAIGRYFDYDHTSVLFGVRAHKQRQSQLPLIPDVQNGYETMKAGQ